MKFEKPIIEGVFLKRYKRFFADVRLIDNTIVTAHVANSGSMKGCNTAESPCLLTYDDNPNRKLKYTLEMIKTPTSWVGVNTQVPNKIVKEALENKIFDHHKNYARVIAEAKINDKSRLDFALTNDLEIEMKKADLKNGKTKFHFIEVKNVSMAENNIAQFPDAVTERGQKHLLELMNLIDWGHTAEILFTIQRTDGKTFSPARHIDPEYAKLLEKALNHGVKITPVLAEMSNKGIHLTTKTLELHI